LAVWGGGGSLLFAGEAAPENSPSGPRLIALRIVGSNVKNPAGEYLGRIEAYRRAQKREPIDKVEKKRQTDVFETFYDTVASWSNPRRRIRRPTGR